MLHSEEKLSEMLTEIISIIQRYTETTGGYLKYKHFETGETFAELAYEVASTDPRKRVISSMALWFLS